MEWQPIETYVDGSGVMEVLLWNGVRVFLGWFSEDDGWSDATNQDRNDYPEDPQPTHWMPLPAPPSGVSVRESVQPKADDAASN